jgi:tetratricopeptide (TPR) repeat protein
MSEGKILCSKCGRVMGNRPKCMYCGGSPQEVHVLTLGPEVADPVGAITAKLDEMRRPAGPALTPAERERRFEAAKSRLVGHIDAGRHEQALAAFDEALALVKSPPLLVAKGLHLKGLNRPAPALACLEEALALDGSLVDAWFEKADLLETLGQLPQSLAAYDRVLEHDPRRVNAWCDRGHVLGRMGRLAEALRSYESALAIDASSPHAWFNKGNAEMALNQGAAARESFRRFLSLSLPPHFAPQVQHARAMLAKLGG